MANNSVERKNSHFKNKQSKSSPIKKSKGQQTREDILAVSEECFSNDGFHGTSINSIAKLVGISKQNLLHYYPSKRELYSAVIENIMIPLENINRITKKLGESFSEPLSFQNRLDADKSLELFIDLITERPSIANLIMAKTEIIEGSSQTDKFSEIGSRSLAVFEETFKKIAPNASAEEIHHLGSSVTGTVLFYASTLDRLTGNKSKKELDVSKTRHKELVIFTAKSLIREINKSQK
tara:strand:- start:3077 stop:3787 length:711 start_codon:yes stop_codon:yes gene_type:complete